MSATKQTPLGWASKIPSHWEVVPLKAVASMGTGHTPDRNKPEYWENCTVPWVTTPDVTRRGGSLAPLMDTEQKVSELGLANSAAVLHPANTVMLSRTASVGYSVRIGRPMATTQAFVTWYPGPRLEPRYLLLVLRAMAQEWERLAYGSTHLTIYMPDLESLRIPLPPLEEQRRIADFLDAETARIDKLLAYYRSLIALLGERVDAACDDLISGHASGYVRLKFLLRRPLSYGANAAAEHVNREWPRYIRTTDIAEDGSLREETFASLPHDEARRYLLKSGDILFVRSGATVGKTFMYRDSLGPAAHAGYLIRASVDESSYIPELLYRFCQTSHYWSQVLGGSIQATIQNVSAEKYADIKVPWIDRNRQYGILREMQQVAQAVAGLKRRAMRSIDLLSERRQALITAAVTGEFDVSAASGRGIEE